MRTIELRIVVPLLAAVLLAVACTPTPQRPLPQTLAEYQQMGAVDRESWDDTLVVKSNLNRVQNPELTSKQRIDSLEVIDHVASRTRNVVTSGDWSELASLLRNPTTPADLNRQVLTVLLRHNYSDLAGYLVPSMGRLQEDPALKQLVLEYFARNPDRSMLVGVIRAWASEPSATGEAEDSYRNTVRELSGQGWEDTLISALNTPEFNAKGEAWDVLRTRMDVRELKTRIASIQAVSATMSALQTMQEVFNYLPNNQQELVASSLIYRIRGDMIPAAARLAVEWARNTNYQFNIRDFHVISRLERDPLRNAMTQSQLLMEISRSLKTRRQVAHRPVAPGAADDYEESFWLQVNQLTMADLWNLYLLDDMLDRPRTKLKLMRQLTVVDQRDRHSACGGLIFYKNGQAEAEVYEPEKNIASDDLHYLPRLEVITDGRDALVRFITHFDQTDNSLRAGPDALELADSKAFNYYGLIITSTSERTFCAHYYTPTGMVVSLGEYVADY